MHHSKLISGCSLSSLPRFGNATANCLEPMGRGIIHSLLPSNYIALTHGSSDMNSGDCMSMSNNAVHVEARESKSHSGILVFLVFVPGILHKYLINTGDTGKPDTGYCKRITHLIYYNGSHRHSCCRPGFREPTAKSSYGRSVVFCNYWKETQRIIIILY
jgi:hypothetical protein